MAKAFTVASIDTYSDHALLFSQLEKVWTPSAWAFMPRLQVPGSADECKAMLIMAIRTGRTRTAWD